MLTHFPPSTHPRSKTHSYTLPHPIWKNEFVDGVEITHTPPENLTDKLAYYTVRLMRCAPPPRLQPARPLTLQTD